MAKALTASARIIDPGSSAERAAVKARSENWQKDAWTLYDEVGEIKYGARFVGRAMSKISFYPAVRLARNERPVPLDAVVNDPALLSDHGIPVPENLEAVKRASEDALLRLDDAADGGLAGLQERWGISQFVAGEAHLILMERDGKEWATLASTSELVVAQKNLALRTEPSQPERSWLKIPNDALVIRFWHRHAQWSERADSAVRGSMDVAETLWLLTLEIAGRAKSRLNNGLLFFPASMISSGLTQAALDDPELAAIEEAEATSSVTLGEIAEHFEQAISDPRSASVAMPFLMTGDHDDIDAVRHMPITRPDDESVKDREDLRIRLATSLDLPPEVILGMAEVNHWTAWHVSDSTYSAHIEPVALAWGHDLGTNYWLPAVQQQAPNNLPLILVPDGSAVVAKPDQTGLALDLHDRLIISDAHAREMTSTPDSAAPDEEELERRAGYGARRSRSTGATRQTAPLTAAMMPVDDLGAHLAQIDRDTMIAINALVDAAMARALERAGAKIRSKAKGQADAISTVDNGLVAATLGRSIVAAIGFEDDDLLSGAFDSLKRPYQEAVERAQRATADAIEEDPQEQTDDGWEWLLAALLLLAAQKLYRPDPTGQRPQTPPQKGAYDDIHVSASIVRGAMAVEGGAVLSPPTDVGKGLTSLLRDPVTGIPVGGIALGAWALGRLRAKDIFVQGYRWWYGSTTTRRDPYPEHVALGNIEFETWDDPVLQGYYPGDHGGCQCTTIPTLIKGA